MGKIVDKVTQFLPLVFAVLFTAFGAVYEQSVFRVVVGASFIYFAIWYLVRGQYRDGGDYRIWQLVWMVMGYGSLACCIGLCFEWKTTEAIGSALCAGFNFSVAWNYSDWDWEDGAGEVKRFAIGSNEPQIERKADVLEKGSSESRLDSEANQDVADCGKNQNGQAWSTFIWVR